MAEGEKAKPEVTQVQLTDGRTVGFTGKQKVDKTVLIDDASVEVGGDGSVTLLPGAIKLRVDFINGETRTYPLPTTLMARFAGHGMSQKYGDELAAGAKSDASVDDFPIWLDELDARIQKGDWRVQRESGGGGVAGASVVVRALMEVTGKDAAFIKAYLQTKLEEKGPDGQAKYSRAALYGSFRAPGTPTAPVIERLEREKKVKAPAVDAAAEVASLMA